MNNLKAFEKVSVYFIDYLSIDEKLMAVFSQKISLLLHTFKSDSNIVVLSTCHRIEFYTSDVLSYDPIKKYLGIQSTHLSGNYNALKRLTNIASGSYSKIRGEKYIFSQVETALKYSDPNEILAAFFNHALYVASYLRRNFNYYADKDYDDLVIDYLAQKDFFSKNTSIIIVGGGMLSRSIFSRLGKINDIDLTILTRSPNQLAKAMTIDINYKSLSMRDFKIESNINLFKCFIATNNITGSYRDRIIKIINHPKCLLTIDFSALPVYNSNVNYYTMYSDEFQSKIVKNNHDLSSITNQIKSYINNYLC